MTQVTYCLSLSLQQTMAQWRKVFWMTVPFYVVTEIVFLVFCSATVQPWNYIGQVCGSAGRDDDDNEDDKLTENNMNEGDSNSTLVLRKAPLVSDLEKRDANASSVDT